MGRDEETGSLVEQRNRPLLPVSLFDLKAVSSSRPADAMTPRADIVKAGRRASVAAHFAVARPRLDGGKHGVKLAAVGLPPRSRVEHPI
jgi:hypothetical protein